MRRAVGEDADEFRLNYRWSGSSSEGCSSLRARLDELGDPTMPIVPCVLEVPPHRRHRLRPARWTPPWSPSCGWTGTGPTSSGLYDHRILNWLEIHGEEWEEQYFRIFDFLSNYSVMAVGVDAQGVGDVAADRLKRLLPTIQVEPLSSQHPGPDPALEAPPAAATAGAAVLAGAPQGPEDQDLEAVLSNR